MPTGRCVQGPCAGQSCSARRLVLSWWSRAGLGSPGLVPTPPDLPRLPPGPPGLRSPPRSSSSSSRSSGGRRSAAGRPARVRASGDPPGARSTRNRAITPWARRRGGAAELSWPGRGRLYPRPEPQEAAPLPRRGWDGGGHVGSGLQGGVTAAPAPGARALLRLARLGPLFFPAGSAGLDSSPCNPRTEIYFPPRTNSGLPASAEGFKSPPPSHAEGWGPAAVPDLGKREAAGRSKTLPPLSI